MATRMVSAAILAVCASSAMAQLGPLTIVSESRCVTDGGSSEMLCAPPQHRSAPVTFAAFSSGEISSWMPGPFILARGWAGQTLGGPRPYASDATIRFTVAEPMTVRMIGKLERQTTATPIPEPPLFYSLVGPGVGISYSGPGGGTDLAALLPGNEYVFSARAAGINGGPSVWVRQSFDVVIENAADCGCVGDLTGDCEVGLDDLAAIILSWNVQYPLSFAGQYADLDGDARVGIGDIGALIEAIDAGSWGPCTP